nr:hypothetical protein [Tanacetum cinerariifolium]
MMRGTNSVGTAYHSAFLLLLGTTYIGRNGIRQQYLFFKSSGVLRVAYLWIHRDLQLEELRRSSRIH